MIEADIGIGTDDASKWSTVTSFSFCSYYLEVVCPVVLVSEGVIVGNHLYEGFSVQGSDVSLQVH